MRTANLSKCWTPRNLNPTRRTITGRVCGKQKKSSKALTRELRNCNLRGANIKKNASLFTRSAPAGVGALANPGRIVTLLKFFPWKGGDDSQNRKTRRRAKIPRYRKRKGRRSEKARKRYKEITDDFKRS